MFTFVVLCVILLLGISCQGFEPPKESFSEPSKCASQPSNNCVFDDSNLQDLISNFTGVMTTQVSEEIVHLKEKIVSLEGTVNSQHESRENCRTDNCMSKWEMVYEHDSKGSVVTGNLAELIQAVLDGARIRVFVKAWKYATEVDNLTVNKGHVSAQHIKSVSKSSWDSFQNDAYWWWVMLSTTGTCQMVRYNIGEHKSRGENTAAVGIQWFVKGSRSAPTYSHNASGGWVSGSLHSLIGKIREGQEVRCVQGDGRYAFPVQGLTVTCNEEDVVGETLNHVSQKDSYPPTFQSNAYWWFSLVSAQGSRDMSRWTVGKHESRGHTNDKVALNWFTDPCWKIVFINDKNGNPVHGTRSELVSAIIEGHRVRISRLHSTGTYTAELDNIRVRSGHVTGQVLPNISKLTSKKFQDDAYWFWQMFSTTGTVKHYRYNVGSKTRRGNTEEKSAIRWYVDTCPWTLVLDHDKGGKVISGSRIKLVNAVKTGASVRLLADNTYLFSGQNLVISPDGQQVGVQTLNHISQSYYGLYEVIIQNNPYWWFTVVSSQGRRDMSRWTVGEHQDRGRTQDQVALKWFVNF